MLKANNYYLLLILFFGLNVFAQTSPNTVVDFNTTDINTTLIVSAAEGVLANDSDADGDTFLIIEFTIVGVTYNVGDTANLPQGDFTLNADGSYTFIPALGFTGQLPSIVYTVDDGTIADTSEGTLILYVETDQDILEISQLSSCNQGYTANGEYKITYFLTLRNKSGARNYHPTSLISNINLTNNIVNTFGSGCIISVDNPIVIISTRSSTGFTAVPAYPEDWTITSLNANFQNFTSSSIFTASDVASNILYPGQKINVSYCVTVDPFCNGRPNPTPSGSGIDFSNTVNVTSSRGNDSENVLLEDFHTTETTVAANLYIEEPSPLADFDGTYTYKNTVIITNDGVNTANNVNYIMGLGNFLNNGVVFNPSITITQVSISGIPVAINTAYDGNLSKELLAPGVSLAAGETIFLEVEYFIGVISSENINSFSTFRPSMTQGALDGFDETLSNIYSYVIWSDALGNHLDRYYTAANATDIPSSNDQCLCDELSMRFLFHIDLDVEKTIVNDIPAASGILDNRDITFQLVLTNLNTSTVQLSSIELIDDLSAFCVGHIVNVGTPTIVSSEALVQPILNPAYDGSAANNNIFDGVSGILEPDKSIVVQFTVEISDFCSQDNIVTFNGENPAGTNVNIFVNGGATEFRPFADGGFVPVIVSVDTDNDGISNSIDIDDDNDGIPDVIEYNGVDPLLDSDGDLTPDYIDSDAPGFVDINGDGLNDNFDFDLDGILNHLDLDSDNDGIFDIVESGNPFVIDNDNNGMTDSLVGGNGLDNNVESNDLPTALLNDPILNTDGTGNDNFLDIDADGDGIVDVIEAQTSSDYIAPNNVVDINGIDTAYNATIPIGLSPIDTDGDAIPDYLDDNSDNDIRPDLIEGWDTNNDGVAETIPSNNDSDNDGLDNSFDIVVNGNTVSNSANNQTPTSFPNMDKPTTPELDWREILLIIVTVNSPTVIEGNDLVFTISLENSSGLSIASGTDINLEIFTADGATGAGTFEVATNIADYTGIPNTPTLITIPATLTSITVPIITTFDDNIYELSEKLTLNATVTSSNTENTQATGIGTIDDNDLPPNIIMTTITETVDEGELLEYSISIDRPSSQPIVIDVQSSDVTAVAPNDYEEFNQSLTIPGTIFEANAITNIDFLITTILDAIDEQDIEALKVDGLVTSGTVATEDLLDRDGFIVDVQVSTVVIDNPIVVEGEPLIFTISLIDENGNPIANFEDVNLNVFSNDDTADNPDDYILFSSALVIPAGEISITVEILTIDDNLNEETETMTLTAVISSGLVSNDPPIVIGIGSIKDNDIPNLFSPNDDNQSDFFEIAGLSDFPNFDIQIFDRWGSEVFIYSNKGNLNPNWWDGTNKGTPAPEGVYYYILNFNESNTKPKTGFIQLVR